MREGNKIRVVLIAMTCTRRTSDKHCIAMGDIGALRGTTYVGA